MRLKFAIACLLIACTGSEPDGTATSAVSGTTLERKVLLVVVGWNEMPAEDSSFIVQQLQRDDELKYQHKDGRTITVKGTDPRSVTFSFAAALNGVSNDAVHYTIVDAVDLTDTPELSHPFDDDIVANSDPKIKDLLAYCKIESGATKLRFDQMWCLYEAHLSVDPPPPLVPLRDWLNNDPIKIPSLLALPDLNTPRSLVDRVANHEIDEIWVFGLGLMLKMDEWGMSDVGGSKVPLMGFSYLSRPDQMWHSFSHRTEAFLGRAYQTDCRGRAYKSNPQPYTAAELANLTLCEKFMMVAALVPPGTGGGFGTCHHPVNAPLETRRAGPHDGLSTFVREYDYDDDHDALSAAMNWTRQLDLSLASSPMPIDCHAWHCTQEDYAMWWFAHMPAGEAPSRDCATNLNWWPVIAGDITPPADPRSLELRLDETACACGPNELRVGGRCVAMPPDCTGYTFDTHGYGFCSGEYNWQQAEDMCAAAGGHLATITSEAEQSFILLHRSDNMWHGLHRTSDCQWHWVTGEPVVYGEVGANDGAWQPGMPDSACGDQDCGSFWNSNGWDDDWCGSVNSSYICEWE